MPKMPIDIKKVLDSIASTGQERNLPVNVILAFDPTADDELIERIVEAFTSSEPGVHISQIYIETTVPEIPMPADLCVIVGGDSMLLGDVASAARSLGVPSVVAINRGHTFFADKPEAAQRLADETVSRNRVTNAAGTASVAGAGRGIPVEDIIDIDLSSGLERPLDELGKWIVTKAPAKRISMAQDFPFLRRPLATELTVANAIQNAAIGLVFFVPGADMPLITLNQAKMVIQMAGIYGRPLTKDRIREVVAVVAGGFGLRAVARRLSAQVPVLGWAIKPTVAATGTLAMGYAAIEFFEENGRLSGLSKLVDSAFDKVSSMAGEGTELAKQAIEL